MAYINTTPYQTSIAAGVWGLDVKYTANDRVATWFLDGKKRGTSKIEGGAKSGGWFTFSNLKPGTEYSIHVEITAPGWQSVVKLDATETTSKPSVSKWDWRASNGTASEEQTKKALLALQNRGLLSDFSYKVWNDLVDKIREIQEAKGVDWLTKYATYEGTKMSSTSNIITAKRFNSLKYNIGYYYSTGIKEVVSNVDIVQGWYFTRITKCINEWIDEA